MLWGIEETLNLWSRDIGFCMAFDLHSSSSNTSIMDKSGKRGIKREICNDPGLFLRLNERFSFFGTAP